MQLSNFNNVQQALIAWEAAGPKIIFASFRAKTRKIRVYIAHFCAPRNDKDEEVKNHFYDRYKSILNKLKETVMSILMGDFNEKLGLTTALTRR